MKRRAGWAVGCLATVSWRIGRRIDNDSSNGEDEVYLILKPRGVY